ncbi:glycosyltransferase [candidate division WWE3 bacterium]|nr:glycosyltransferase [candidate division WWE3 bacterium]
MNIALFTDTFLPQINGIATSVANFAEELANRGHKVMVVAPYARGSGPKFHSEKVHLVYLPSVPLLVYPDFRIGVFSLPKVFKSLKAFNPDVIHVHTSMATGIDALITARMMKKPVVGTIHTYLTNPNYLNFIASRIVITTLSDFILSYCKFFFDACDEVLCPSKRLIDDLKKSGYKKRIKYLPNAVKAVKAESPSGSLSSKKLARLREKLNVKGKVLLHVGRLSAEKRVDNVIKAFARVRKGREDLKLVIVGDGVSKLKLKELCIKLGVGQSVVFVGSIPHSELLSSGIFKIADIFVTASPMENQPMVVLEAMAFGLPLIGVSEAGMVELVKDNGYLVRDGNIEEMARRIEKVLSDDSLRVAMSKKSLERIEEFSIGKVTDRLESIYKRVKVTKKRRLFTKVNRKVQSFVKHAFSSP